MALNDLLATPGQPNMGGIIDHFYVADVTKVDEAGLGALALDVDGKTLSANFPLLTNEKFSKIYFTKGDDAKLSYPLVGPRDAKSRDVMVDVKHPGLVAANEVVIDELSNTPIVGIVKDAQGKWRLVGINKRFDNTLGIDFPMYMETDEAGTGGNATEKPGHTLQFKGELPHTPIFYTGSVDLDALT